MVLRSLYMYLLACLYVEANSKKICLEISFPSLFRKMVISRQFFGKMHGYLNFPLWIPIAFAKIYFCT